MPVDTMRYIEDVLILYVFGQYYHFQAFQNMWKLKDQRFNDHPDGMNKNMYYIWIFFWYIIHMTYVWKKAQKPSVGWCSNQQLHGFIVVHSAQDQSVGWIWSKVCRGRAHVERWGEPKMDFPKRGELKNSRVFEIRAAGGVVKDIFRGGFGILTSWKIWPYLTPRLRRVTGFCLGRKGMMWMTGVDSVVLFGESWWSCNVEMFSLDIFHRWWMFQNWISETFPIIFTDQARLQKKDWKKLKSPWHVVVIFQSRISPCFMEKSSNLSHVLELAMFPTSPPVTAPEN